MVGSLRAAAAFAEESAEVELLSAQALKFKDIGKKIAACQARVNDLGRSLQQALGPVYSDTQSLQIVTENADRLLSELHKQTKPLEGKADEERTVRDGPTKAGLQNYLASLKRVEEKLSKLKSTNFRVNQDVMADMTKLLAHGVKQLQGLFRQMVEEGSQPVEPLHYITKQLPFPAIPQKKISDLAVLDSFMSTIRGRNADYGLVTSDSFEAYIEYRGVYLSSSLQNLASASISTSRKMSTDTIYRQGTSGIGTYAKGIEGIFLAEWRNITLVFSRDSWSSVFQKTTQKALAEFFRTLRELGTQIKANITTDCFLAYEIVGIVTQLAIAIDSQTGDLKQQFIDAVKPIRDIAKASIGDLLDDIRRRIAPMVSFPTDGAALPLTAEVMTRLQNLIIYSQSVSSILASLGDGNWSSAVTATGSSTSLPSTKSFDVGADGNQLLAHYVLDTIDVLLSNMESRGKILLKSRAVLGVFIANNVAVIDRMVRNSDLRPLLTATSSPSKLDAWRKKGTASYLDAWREPCAALMDVQYTNRGARPPSANTGAIDSAAVVKTLSSRDKDAIKEKFKAFNISFEGLSAKHREMAPSMENEVRVHLAREIQGMIEPLYARFWDRYHEVDKGKGKYVRYDKGSLSSQLASIG